MMGIESDLEFLARDIEHAELRELELAAQFFANQANGTSFSPARRLIYKAFANFLKLYIRKYGRVRTFASKSEQRRVEHQTGRNRL